MACYTHTPLETARIPTRHHAALSQLGASGLPVSCSPETVLARSPRNRAGTSRLGASITENRRRDMVS